MDHLIDACVVGHLSSIKYYASMLESLQDEEFNPLHYASMFNHGDVIEHLLVTGSRIDFLDMEGETALFKAVRCGCKNTVQILLNHDAKIDIRNRKGQTVFDVCTDDDILKLLKDYDEMINGSTGIDPCTTNSRNPKRTKQG